ncbi:hypothetical protein ACQ31_gp013 [Salmonella phage STML-198]|uniref:Uncharacterized protein n=1 Tax=Salmonella phage STML-198 TaxID=1204531 RepID=K4I1U3_9CAUD|nr:hypothetical protein ACQ31_gp013 [Salmonella phage STML-198]AFU63896.1 hypothetical protein [Salmonella phage STML-198]UPW42322.1 hypothetical protein EBPHNEJP_00024 [Salmonella phage CF-SP2]
MITLVEAIRRIRETEYRPCRPWLSEDKEFTEDGVQEIKTLLHFDRCFNSIDPSTYDAVLLGDVPWVTEEIEVGKRFAGDVLFDKKERFKDGCYIIIGTVLSVEKLFSEISLVKTRRSTYLVIK